MAKLIVAVFVAVCAIANAWSAVVRYDSAATGTGDGSSWANAYTNIASAISVVSTAGGEVWVKQGTHKTPNGGFSLANGVTVKGGFKGEDGADDAARDIAAYETILKPASGNYLVRQSFNCDGTAILDGVTLTDAQYAYDNTAAYSQPLFRACIFRGKAGVGVRSGTKAGVDFSGCTFDNLSGGYNYGTINCEKGGPNTYTDCTFKNYVAGSMYGLVQNNVTTTFTRCRFLNNSMNRAGYCLTYHPAYFDDCTFVGNVMTNGTALAVFNRLRNCVVASNAVVNLNAEAGQSALLTSQDPQWTSTLRTPIERCSFFDNKVIRLGPSVTEKSVTATLVHFARTGNALVGSTFARNVCTATSGSVDAQAVGAILDQTADNYGGVIACAFVDNACSTADIVDLGRTGGSHSLIANCLFRRQNAVYNPIRGLQLDTATKGFHVSDSFIQGYDATAFKLIEETNVTAAEPTLYNAALSADGHLSYALRSDAAETAVVPDVTVATGGGLYAVAGRYAGWTDAPSGTAENLKDLVTGEARPAGDFTCGPTQTSAIKADKLMFRARVTPVGVGKIAGGAYQDVTPKAAPRSVTAEPVAGVVFKGWRIAGTETIVSTDPTYSAGAMTDDLSLEAVFGVPKTAYTYVLGDCGTFDENHLSTITKEYDIGAVPSYPAYTPTPNWHLVGWDQALPATVGDTAMTFTMRGFEKAHRIRRYDSQADAGGDGTTWATAYNSLSAAIADAGQWTGEVWIKEGLHTLTEADGVSLVKNVAVRGGFAGVDGAFANDDAERAARDFTAHYTALQGKTTGGSVFKQTTDADATSTVDSLAITNTQYAYFSTRANTKPVFTNCWFIGKAGLFANASGANLTVVDSRIENISGGNNWGPIHVEGQGNGLFSGCTVKRCVGTTNYGIFDLVGKTVFTNCLFEGNTSAGYLVNAPNSALTEFYGCRFVTNRLATSGGGYYLVEGLKFLNCSFVSNVVTTTGTATGELRLVHATGETTVENTTFFANEMVRDQPTLAGATVNAALIPLANWKMNLINCTFARNVARTTVGEGTTVRSATLLTSGNYGFTIRNSTFVDNDVETAEIVEVNRTSGSGFDTILENTVSRNEKTGYRPIRTLGTSTSRVTVNSCVLPGYDTSLFGYKGGNGKVLTAQPAMRSRPVWEKNQLCYVLRKNAAYKDFCVAGPATDIVGNPRPAGKVTPGSYQPLAKEGFALIVR